jgi:alpha-tubulin suppressor-like RCC1 family protein
MRKWLTVFAVAAASMLILLLVELLQPDAPWIRMGKPLAPGSVSPQLVNGFDSAVLLAPDGSLWAWGGTITQLRSVFPRPTISQVPRRIGAESDWTHVSGGLHHMVALKSNGSLWAWGRNGEGEVGQGNLVNHYGTPTRVGTESNWTQICAGSAHSLALRNDGSLWAWGYNADGELGDGTTNDRAVPTMIDTNRDWKTVAAGGFASFALKSNGTIWGWGGGSSSNELAPKQIASGTNWLAFSAARSALLALKTDGTLWVTGLDAPALALDFVSNSLPEAFTQIGRDADWTEVYAGYSSFYARKKNGNWWVCGVNMDGQLGLGMSIAFLPSPRRLPYNFEPWAFAPGNATTLLLSKDGKLWTWGKRLGAGKLTAVRQKILSFLAPALWVFPALGLPFRSDIDKSPHLLWELPPEVRRSLGAGMENSTNHLTAGHPTNTLHE